MLQLPLQFLAAIRIHTTSQHHHNPGVNNPSQHTHATTVATHANCERNPFFSLFLHGKIQEIFHKSPQKAICDKKFDLGRFFRSPLTVAIYHPHSNATKMPQCAAHKDIEDVGKWSGEPRTQCSQQASNVEKTRHR